MSFPDLRAFLAQLERDGALVTVDVPVDPRLEVAEIHRRVIAAGGPAILFTNVKDLWIGKEPGFVHFDVQEPDRRSDLGCRNAPPAAPARLPVSKRIPQIVGHEPDCRGSWVGDRLALGSQNGVTQQSDSMNGHLNAILSWPESRG